MRAAARFVADLHTLGAFDDVEDIRVDLYGSLAATGAGHGTMTAILLGLEGYSPDKIETDQMERRIDSMRATGLIDFGGSRKIALTEQDMVLRPLTMLPFHPNGMTITAFGPGGAELALRDLLLDRRRLRRHRSREPGTERGSQGRRRIGVQLGARSCWNSAIITAAASAS